MRAPHPPPASAASSAGGVGLAPLGQTPKPFAGGDLGSAAQLDLLGNRGIFDTPFNIATDKLIPDQQASTVCDAAANNPAVRSVYSEATSSVTQ